MKRSKLTCIFVGLGFASGAVIGCTPTEAPQPTTTVQPVKSAPEDAHAAEDPREDAAADADDGEDEEAEDPTSAKPDAARGKADAGHDAGLDGGARDAGKRADAGDAGDGGDQCGSYVELENSPSDLSACEQFQSDDCSSYADEVCQEFHAFREHQVFAAFVSCVSDTPGLDLCDEDQSTVNECMIEAKAKACRTHQPACEAYDGCETISVDECDEAVASISENAVEVFGDVYDCEISPTYFLE